MKNNKSQSKNKKLKLKDVYLNNKSRRFNEIVSIKSNKASLISNPKKAFAKNKYKIIIAVIILLALLLSTMYNDLPTFFITIGFLLGVSLIIIFFNAFKLVCNKDGINVSFGIQKAFFPYDKIKCIYLSKYDDYSFLRFSKNYNIVLNYVDNNGFIKELSFSTLFVTPQEIDDFLNNFVINKTNSEEVVKFEKFKLVRRILRTVLYVGLIVAIIVFYFIS